MTKQRRTSDTPLLVLSCAQCKVSNIASRSQNRRLICPAGGPDPKLNSNLALVLANARRASLPKTVIEASIARAQGKSVTGEALESVTIEAMLPPTVAAVIEAQAEKKGTVLQNVRKIIKDVGGAVTPTAYLFEKKGRIIIEKKDESTLSSDDYLNQAIEAGAVDISTDEEGRLVVITEPAETKRVAESLAESTGLTVEELEIFWDPNKDTLVNVDEAQAGDLEKALAALREESTVQDIYLNTASKFE